MTYFPRTIAPLALALAGVAAAVPAEARQAPAVEPAAVQYRISYHPYELATRAGAEALYRRIGRAARDACRLDGIAAIVARAGADQCRAEIIDRAVAQVGSAALAAIHDGRGEMISLAARH
jgi:UrcA family protein